MPSDIAIGTGQSLQPDPAVPAGIADFLPEMLRHDLSREQVAAIERAAQDWTRARGRQLPVDLRFSLPLPFRGVFVNVMAGSERRSRARRAEERRHRPLATVGNVMLMTCMVGLLYSALLLAALALSGIVE
jgi:hypothetical protein